MAGGAGPSGAETATPPDGRSPLAVLGEALQARAAEVGERVLQRAESILAAYDDGVRGQIVADTVRTCTMGTAAVALVLITGRLPTAEEWRELSAVGRAAAGDSITLTDMTKLYLYWRDLTVDLLGDMSHDLGIDAGTRRAAEAVVRAGCDSSLVRMAKAFDVKRRELHAQLAEDRMHLARLARHDSLTGLANRLTLLDRLRELIHECRSHANGAAVLFVDLDRFKSVNDAAGHSVGDQLLVGVAERLSRVVRPGDTVARLGGDEFIVACGQLEDPASDALLVASRINAALAEPFDIGDDTVSTSASIGLTIVSGDSDPECLLAEADAAMYRAKQHGRDRFEVYEAIAAR